MAVRTISTSIKLDGEQEFKKQMSSVNSELKNLKSEMALATAEFKGNANSMDALTAKGQILRREYAQQAEKVRALERAVEDASEAYGEADSRTDAYKRQLNYAKTALANLNSEIQDNERYLDEAKRSADRCADSIDEYGREVREAADADIGSPLAGLDDLAGKLGGLKGALMGGAAVGGVAAGVQAVTGAITEVVDGSAEYRKVMGTLEVSSQAAGYTAEETAQTYERLYSVLGDNQTAATTVANLQAIELSQEKLMQMTYSSIGAWARYGDSIPIDGLAESVNESIRCGEVTGVLADVLNWGSREGENFGVKMRESTEANKEWNEAVENAKTAEDFFNLALSECSTESERADLVLQAMAKQGLAEAGQAWIDTNDDIVATNESQAKFEEAQAKLGEILSCYGGNIFETNGRGDPSSEIGDVDVMWLDESTAATARRMMQSFPIRDGVLQGAQVKAIQADGSYLFENCAVITQSGQWQAPPGVDQLFLAVGQGAQGGMRGQDGTLSEGERPSINVDTGVMNSGGTYNADYGQKGDDGVGGKIWYGTININPQQIFDVHIGEGGAPSQTYGIPGSMGEETTFGAYSSANGQVFPNGYTDIRNGAVYGRTGVKAPVDGSSDGAAGGAGGEPGIGEWRKATLTIEGSGRKIWYTYWRVVKEPGRGKVPSKGADGFVLIWWDKPEA